MKKEKFSSEAPLDQPTAAPKPMEITVSEEVKRDLEEIARTILSENVNEKRSEFFIVVREGTPEFQKYEDDDFFYSFTLDKVHFHVSTY